MSLHQPRSSSFNDVLRHYLGDVVYGGNDGIVTTFAVISGVAGAQLSVQTMFVIIVVNLLADGFSMAASNFLSIRSAAEVQGVSRGSVEPFYHATATFISFIALGAMPLLGFLLGALVILDPFIVSSIVTAFALFLLGAVRSTVSLRKWYTAGLENLVIGAVAAVVAYYCGKIMAYLL